MAALVAAVVVLAGSVQMPPRGRGTFPDFALTLRDFTRLLFQVLQRTCPAIQVMRSEKLVIAGGVPAVASRRVEACPRTRAEMKPVPESFMPVVAHLTQLDKQLLLVRYSLSTRDASGRWQ